MSRMVAPTVTIAVALTIGGALLSAGCITPKSFADAATDAPTDAHRVSDIAGPLAVRGPNRLSATGLYSDFATRRLAEGIIEYSPRHALWSDGDESHRYFLLPPGSRIDTSNMDHWVFPVGTRAWKTFSVNGRLVETRIFQKMGIGLTNWWMVAYVWNSDESEAIAAPDGLDNARATTHHVPSQDECLQCHRSVSDVIIGVSAIELAGRTGSGSLSDFVARGILTNPPSTEPRVPGEGAVQAVLGYFHGNCGYCHNNESYFNTESELRMRLVVGDRDATATGAYLTSIRVPMHHEFDGITIGVTPGAPERSQLFVRMGLRDERAMPPIGSLVTDPVGMGLVRDWINSLQ